MVATKLLPMSNAEVENRAIAFVLAHERAVGREPRDTRHGPSAQVDVESVDPATGAVHLIEVKAYGGTGRGEDLWLEPRQVSALEGAGHGHLYIVTQVRSEDPAAIRILDLSGTQLQERLAAKKLKKYYSVPLPTAAHDALTSKSPVPPTTTGEAFVGTLLEAVTLLHGRGYHSLHFEAMRSPSGMNLRVFVGDRGHLPEGSPAAWNLERVAYTSENGSPVPTRDLHLLSIPSWWNPVMVADALLAALPRVEPAGDDPAYVERIAELAATSRATGAPPLTVPDTVGGFFIVSTPETETGV